MDSKSFIGICFIGSLASQASAALIVSEQFETDGDGGARYLSSAFSDGADFFNRHNYASQNPHPQHSDQNLLSVGGGAHNEWAWAMEDITDTNNPLGSAGPAVLRLNNINISSYTNITLTVSVATIFNNTLLNDTFDIDDGLDIQIALGIANSGGTSGSPNPTLLNGSYTTIGSFRGQGDITSASLAPREVASGTALSNQLQDFTYDVTPSGDFLSVQFVGLSLDGSEELIFDNIRIEGTLIPEPSSSILLLAGLSLGLVKRRR